MWRSTVVIHLCVEMLLQQTYISAGGPYEGGVVLSTQSAGFLGAVFDG